MRKINFSDVFGISRIVKKSNIKEDIASLFASAKSSTIADNINEIGAELIITIFENCGGAEEDIISLISSISERKKEDIKNADLCEIIDIFKQIASENDLKQVFSQVSSLTAK